MRASRPTLMLAGVVALSLSALGAASVAASPSAAGDPAKGRYIVAANGGCDCHGPDLAGFKEDAPAAQSGEMFRGAFGSVTAKNITPDKETGIGDWTDDEVINAIRNGVDADGMPLFPIMPYVSFHFMSNTDVADLVAFLRTIPAVRNDVPENELNVSVPAPPSLPPSPATAPTSGIERGRYLVSAISICGNCHTPSLPSGVPDTSKFLAGGTIENEIAANLTPDKVTGIGNWTDAQIAAVLRFALEPEGTRVSGLMFYLDGGIPLSGGFSQLTDSDRGAIVAFLRTIPAVSNVAANGAGFQFGFKTLSDLLPAIVGLPLENQHPVANGDILQQTTGGVLQYRPSTNVPSFTDGFMTWLLGPFGLQERLNTQRFDWER